MRKMIKLLYFSLLIMLFLSGCNSEDMKPTSDVFQYKDSFVGDNNAVGNIANQLQGAEHMIGFELETNEEPYGIILNYDWIDSEQNYKKTAIYNATFFFALIQNVDWITFNFEMSEYTLTRESLQDWYGMDLSEINNEDDLRELIQEYLEDENKRNQLRM